MAEIEEKTKKNKIIVKNEEFLDLLDADRALILAIQDLTRELKRLVNK